MTRLPFAAVLILLANVILLAPGCGLVPRNRMPVSRSWLAELPPENRAVLTAVCSRIEEEITLWQQ